jgi:hypothetical protein
MSSLVEMALKVVLLPGVLAGVLALAAALAGRRAGLTGAGPAAVALALGAAVLAAQVVNARPAFPPVDVTDRIPYLVLAATLLGLCEALRPAPGWARWENRLLLTLLVLGAILAPVLGPDWHNPRALAGLLGLVLGVLAAWVNLEALAARRSTAVLGPALLVVAAGTAAAFLLSQSAALFQIEVGLAAALGAVWVLSWWLPILGLGRGGVPVLVAATAALLVDAQVYSGLLRAPAILLACAPLAAWAGLAGPMGRLRPWLSSLIMMLATLVPTAIAVALVYAEAPEYE